MPPLHAATQAIAAADHARPDHWNPSLAVQQADDAFVAKLATRRVQQALNTAASLEGDLPAEALSCGAVPTLWSLAPTGSPFSTSASGQSSHTLRTCPTLWPARSPQSASLFLRSPTGKTFHHFFSATQSDSSDSSPSSSAPTMSGTAVICLQRSWHLLWLLVLQPVPSSMLFSKPSSPLTKASGHRFPRNVWFSSLQHQLRSVIPQKTRCLPTTRSKSSAM